MKFAFVILHYNVVAETERCINSILEKCDQRNFIVIVVDNNSPNGSGVFLKREYENFSNIEVLLNEKNLGFARGNNVGIYCAREKYNADFVIVLNNDTYLIQENFCSVILEEWGKSKFAVMGPYVATYGGKNQNPMHTELNTIKKVNTTLRRTFFALVRAYCGVDILWNTIKSFVKTIIRGPQNVTVDEIRQENVKLHGCCYVFSPKFFEHFKGFDPRTFMYAEEDILLAQIRSKQLLTVYNPNLKIFHAEKAATKSTMKTNRKKKIFECKESIKSLKILRIVLNECIKEPVKVNQ